MFRRRAGGSAARCQSFEEKGLDGIKCRSIDARLELISSEVMQFKDTEQGLACVSSACKLKGRAFLAPRFRPWFKRNELLKKISQWLSVTWWKKPPSTRALDLIELPRETQQAFMFAMLTAGRGYSESGYQPPRPALGSGPMIEFPVCI